MFSMGDQVLIKSKRLRIINSQKKTIVPDVILHTKNMIPVVKPVILEQSFNIPSSENRPQILKAQYYRNNPALMFSRTLSYTLHNHLENLYQVKRVKHQKTKNQNTKYTIFKEIDSTSVMKTRISQNLYPSKKLSRKKKDNLFHFPNTIPAKFISVTNSKELYRASSESIQLSRKYNLLPMKETAIKNEDNFIMPKVELPISNTTSTLQIVSLPSKSSYNANIISAVQSTLSISTSNFDFGNEKTLFANIENRETLLSRIASNHLCSSSSEYEINVLHYENNVLSGDEIPRDRQLHSKSLTTNWSSIEHTDLSNIQNHDNWNFSNVKNVMAENNQKWNVSKAIRDVKYSWEVVDDWVPPSRRREYKNRCKIKNFELHDRKFYDCKIKYSWQVMGTSTQTSYTLLPGLLTNNYNAKDNELTHKTCSIKYSWQIIGISTQASLHNCDDSDYWNGILMIPNKNYNSSGFDRNEIDCTKRDYLKYSEGRLKRYLILNNQQTQTSAEKNIQADTNNFYSKYSWHNLIKQYL